MKKRKTATIVICLLAAVAVAILGSFLIMNSEVYNIKFTRQVTLNEGVVEPEMTEMIFMVEENGEYKMLLEWEASQPGLLNGVRIADKQDKTVFAGTGESASIETRTLYLEAGEYVWENYYLTSEEAFVEFFEKFFEATDTEQEFIGEETYEYAAQGQWEINYEFELMDAGNNPVVYGALIGVIIGLLLVVVMLAITKTDDTIKCNFDER